jgi:hypothetical protein
MMRSIDPILLFNKRPLLSAEADQVLTSQDCQEWSLLTGPSGVTVDSALDY